MSCRRVCSLLSAYIDGELTGEEQLRIRDHLRYCPCCAEEVDSLRDTKRALSNLRPVSPRVGFETELVDRIRERPAAGTGLSFHRLFASPFWSVDRRRARLAAALALTSIGLLAWSARTVVLRQNEATPPVTSLAHRAVPIEPLLPARETQFLHEPWDRAQPVSDGGPVYPRVVTRDGAR